MPLPTIAKPSQPLMAMPEGDPVIAVDKSGFAPKRGWGCPCKSYADAAAAATVPTVVDSPSPQPAVVPQPQPIVSSDLGMMIHSGCSHQPAAGGGNPTVSDAVEVSVINTDDEWAAVIHSNKQKKMSQWGKWSKLEHRNFEQFGDTYKMILCDHSDPLQVQAPALAVVQIPVPALAPIFVPPVVIPHNVSS